MSMSPKQIVAELDRYIIGQSEAKRAVAIALRNRYRRSQLSEELRQEITPKNIIMKGPTGVGKTEIARRLAKLVKAPFIKVEATKFTEVGYVGRDVESMVRDLVETSAHLVKEEKMAEVEAASREAAEKRILEVLLAEKKRKNTDGATAVMRETLLRALREGREDNTIIEVEIAEAPKPLEMPGGMGMEINLSEMLGGLMPKRKKTRKVTRERSVGRGRKPRGRSARHTSHSGRIDGADEVRKHKDGLHTLHRVGRVHAGKSGGSHTRTSRQIPYTRGTRQSDVRRFRKDPHRTRKRDNQTVCGAPCRG